MADAPLMARVRSRYFPELSQPAMLDDVLAGLVKARAATVDGDIVCNHD